MSSSTMAPHPLTLPELRSKSRRKAKLSNHVLLRAFGILAAFVVLAPILFLQYRLNSSSAVHDKLQEFQDGPASTKRKSLSKPRKPLPSTTANNDAGQINHDRKILTAYLESPDTLKDTTLNSQPLSATIVRNTTADRLIKIEFPHVRNCATLMQDFPVDDYPTDDPFLPWIHDYFPSQDGRHIRFVAQNRRRCDTGQEHVDVMKYWEPQVALFQPIPIVVAKGESYRLATSLEEATHNATRFQCRFHWNDKSRTTLSVYPFDYEYVTWRKMHRPMLDRSGGTDMGMFWLSTLLFSCPVPKEFQELISESPSSTRLYLDLIPIRTPVRTKFLLTANHTGPTSYRTLPKFHPDESFGKEHFLPLPEDAGRWANLPICLPRQTTNNLVMKPKKQEKEVPSSPAKPYRLVACTWTSALYSRRGDVVSVSDSAQRLHEWIHFHLMVGVEHLYVYDNSDGNTTDLWDVTQQFQADQVSYHRWPCHICNNNRPAHKNPGERSSQYAAEASCRERYGPTTEWMTFLDTDEYLVPMKANNEGAYTWHTVLDDMDQQNMSILQLLSSRAKPRVDLMEVLEDQSTCIDPANARGPNKDKTEPCVGPKRGETFLNVQNCEFIRPPKPQRFERARKQIYRTSHVLSHFVHYSTVTADLAETYSEFVRRHSNSSAFIASAQGRRWEKQSPERFLNELTQGALVHARSVLPHETRRRSAECYLGSKFNCMVGHLCEDSVKFVDDLHKDNVFNNADGSYCNCWKNPVVDQVLVPLLKARMKDMSDTDAK